MDQRYKALLEKQGYNFIGEHSACKTCHYTAQKIKGGEGCYKEKFYGIKAHQCVQMSVAVNFCNMDCVFCWRARNNSSFGKIDDPTKLIDNAIASHRKLLTGYKGNKNADLQKWKEAVNPKHFAISLNGENTAYPRLGEFIEELQKRGLTSFLVTNGQLPAVLEKIPAPTQLYISLSAPNEELFRIVDRPLLKDGWNRLMKSLEVMKKRRKETRTAIRMTIVRGLTDVNPEQYAELIKKANPHFVEVKSYSWMGASKERLKRSNVMEMDEIRKFADDIGKHCGYRIVDEQEIGRICLLMEEDFPERVMRF